MSAPFLIVFLYVCLYHRDMEIVMDKEIRKIKPLLIFFHFPSVWPAQRQQMCSPFCSSTQSICWCLCVAWCGVGVPWASWWWGSLSAVGSVPHSDKASQKCWRTACASSPCSHCTCFRSSCLLICNPRSLPSRDYHCVFVEASCEPKSTAVTKSASRASSANVGDTSHQHLKRWREFCFPCSNTGDCQKQGTGLWGPGRCPALQTPCLCLPSLLKLQYLFYWYHPLISMLQPTCYNLESRARNYCLGRKSSENWKSLGVNSRLAVTLQ